MRLITQRLRNRTAKSQKKEHVKKKKPLQSVVKDGDPSVLTVEYGPGLVKMGNFGRARGAKFPGGPLIPQCISRYDFREIPQGGFPPYRRITG